MARRRRTTPRMTGTAGNGGSVVPTESGALANSPLLAAPTGPVAPGTPHRIWSNEIPQRQSALHRPGRRTGHAARQPHPGRPPASGGPAYLRHGRRRQNRNSNRVHSPAQRQIRDHLVDPRRAYRSGQGRAGQAGAATGIAAGRHGERPGPDDRGGPGNAGVRQSGRTGCWSTTTRRSRSTCSGTCRPARRAATSSSPRGCRTGPVTSKRTASRSRPSPRTRPSASCAAGYRSSARTGGSAPERGRAAQSARRDGWPAASVICPSPSSTPRPT